MILFAERPPGYDRVRNAEIGNKDFELDVLEEAYTTEHWLVRIYKVNLKKPSYLAICWIDKIKHELEKMNGLFWYCFYTQSTNYYTTPSFKSIMNCGQLYLNRSV